MTWLAVYVVSLSTWRTLRIRYNLYMPYLRKTDLKRNTDKACGVL